MSVGAIPAACGLASALQFIEVMLGRLAEGSNAEIRPWAMSRPLADQILRVQAELARLRDRHSGPDGDPRTVSLLDEAEALLAQAVGLHADPKAALRAAQATVMTLGATPAR